VCCLCLATISCYLIYEMSRWNFLLDASDGDDNLHLFILMCQSGRIEFQLEPTLALSHSKSFRAVRTLHSSNILLHLGKLEHILHGMVQLSWEINSFYVRVFKPIYLWLFQRKPQGCMPTIRSWKLKKALSKSNNKNIQFDLVFIFICFLVFPLAKGTIGMKQ